MKRRDFIKNTAIGTASVGIAPSIALAQNKKFRWRISLAVPKTMPIWGDSIKRFVKNVEILSSGRLKIKIYGAGELVPAFEILDKVKSGEIDMGHAASYYWLGKIPEAVFFTTIPFGLDSVGQSSWVAAGEGQKLWEEVMAPHNIISMPCGNTGPQHVGWFKKEVNSLEDFKGLKIRASGLTSKVYERLGAKTIAISGGELFTSLATGVIDVVEWAGPYLDYQMGFQRAAKFVYSSSWHEPGPTLELMINKKSWETLPEDLQQVVRICANETDRWMLTQFTKLNADYLQKIKENKEIKVKSFSPEITESLKRNSKEILAELSNTNPLAKKVYSSYIDFQKKHDELNSFTKNT